MMENIDNHVWWRSSSGYAWQRSQAPAKTTRSLPSPALVPIGSDFEPYQPAPWLFVDFARLDVQSNDAILAFANRYGLLGGVWSSDELTPEEESQTCDGEPRVHWRNQHTRLNRAIQLYTAIKLADTEYLATVLKWVTPDRIELATRNPSGTIAATDYRAQLLKRFQTPDLILPAQIYLEDLLNEQIGEFVSYKFRWIEGFAKLADAVRPNCLLGYFWLRFAVAIQEGRTFSHCEMCDTLMLSAPERAKPSTFWKERKTCGDACRARKYQNHKRELQLQETQTVEA